MSRQEKSFSLNLEFKHFPSLAFVVSSMKRLLSRQNNASPIIDDSLKCNFRFMIFLLPAENAFLHNFPAAFSMSGGVVTGGGGCIKAFSENKQSFVFK